MFLPSISSCFLSFQFVRSGTAKLEVHAQFSRLFCVLFTILRGLVQEKALNLGVLTMIVHPAPRCGKGKIEKKLKESEVAEGSGVGVRTSTPLISLFSSFFFPLSLRPSTREPAYRLLSRWRKAVKTRASRFCMCTENNTLEGGEKRLILQADVLRLHVHM